MHKPLARLRKKRLKVTDEREAITVDASEVERVIRDCFECL